MAGFTFTAPFGSIAPVAYNVDLSETKPYPSVFLAATETNGQVQSIQGVNGDLWVIKNGYWNGSLYLPVTMTLASYAWRFPTSGGFQLYTSALVGGAAQNPLVWVLEYTVDASGNVTTPGNITCANLTASGSITGTIQIATIASLPFIRAGSQANVLCDGSATTAITYASPFPNSTQGAPQCTISSVSAANQMIGQPQCSSITQNGFSVYIPGAAPGTTCTVTYWANGQ